MPTTIVTKNSSTASAAPSAGSLTQGELAVNVTDQKLYTKNSSGTVVELTGLKSSAIGVSVQAYDVDTAKTDVAQSFTAKQSFSTTMKVQQTLEKMTVSATASTGTINFDTLTQSALYYTTNASGNFTVNFRGDGSNSLDSIMATGEALTLVFMSTQGATAYYNSAVTIDGSSVTPKWQGGTAPTSGNASGIDSYVYSIIKTASATFTVLASQTQFK
jgi:hypothetical protein